MNKKISNEILNILKTIIINPKPELDFNNNFELVVAVALSAQTTDKRVNEVTKILFEKYKTPYDLMNASVEDVKNIISPLGLAKNKSNNIINLSKILVEKYNGEVPGIKEELIKLPGVGNKTANVVLALGFNVPAFPVDTHLIRMANRLGYVKDETNPNSIEKIYKKYIDEDQWILAHHLFLLFGRYHCKAISPDCKNCKLINYCRYKDKKMI
ncbi:MAG: endonuclease III [Acholeplasmatales bacterium]|nr:endonuclease III [Acholeplasmatales bacterium]